MSHLTSSIQADYLMHDWIAGRTYQICLLILHFLPYLLQRCEHSMHVETLSHYKNHSHLWTVSALLIEQSNCSSICMASSARASDSLAGSTLHSSSLVSVYSCHLPLLQHSSYGYSSIRTVTGTGNTTWSQYRFLAQEKLLIDDLVENPCAFCP